MTNVVKDIDLDKKNKISVIKKDGLFVVSSFKKVFFGLAWKKSKFAMTYQTNLVGQKIVDGGYQGFKSERLAVEYMEFLAEKYGKIKFIG